MVVSAAPGRLSFHTRGEGRCLGPDSLMSHLFEFPRSPCDTAWGLKPQFILPALRPEVQNHSAGWAALLPEALSQG